VDYTGIRVITEIRLSTEDDYGPVELVNSYLSLGWIILGVHQRAIQSDTLSLQTVYILGSFDDNPRHPETDG
jgi:hypothetical protein